MKATITKVLTDLIDERTGKYHATKAWKIEIDGMVIFRPGSKSKKYIRDLVSNNFGYETEITFEDKANV